MASKSSKAAVLDVPAKKKGDTVNFFARVKKINWEFMKKQASERNLSLSAYTDAVLDNLRGK